jgi:hypothetical protein
MCSSFAIDRARHRLDIEAWIESEAPVPGRNMPTIVEKIDAVSIP